MDIITSEPGARYRDEKGDEWTVKREDDIEPKWYMIRGRAGADGGPYRVWYHSDGKPVDHGPRILSRIEEPETEPNPSETPNSSEWKPGEECEAEGYEPGVRKIIAVNAGLAWVTSAACPEGIVVELSCLRRPVKKREWFGQTHERGMLITCSEPLKYDEWQKALDVCRAALNQAEADNA